MRTGFSDDRILGNYLILSNRIKNVRALKNQQLGMEKGFIYSCLPCAVFATRYYCQYRNVNESLKESLEEMTLIQRKFQQTEYVPPTVDRMEE